MEVTIIIDVLRRAGWDVVAAGVTGTTVTCSRGVSIVTDAPWNEIDPAQFDVLVIPGGGQGTRAMASHGGLLDAIRQFDSDDKILAAICAGPEVLYAAGILRGRKITSYPSCRDALNNTEWANEKVVLDGRLLTSQGPGTAIPFALALVELVDGPAARQAVAGPMLA